MSTAACAPKPRHRTALSRWADRVVAPATFDFWASRLHPTWSWSRPLARIVGRQPESRDSVTIHLQPNRHWSGFQPGQHVNVSAELDGVRVTRSYSLSDTARADGRIAITVKVIEGGKLSEHLARNARVGDVLDLGPAFGEMVLPASAADPLLFLAAGSGITPLMALVRAQAAHGMPRDLSVLYWARHRDELCFVDELRRLSMQHPGFRVRFVLTREAATASDECYGRISPELLATLVPDAQQRHVYGCGPRGFVDNAHALLAHRVPHFQAEAFTPPRRDDSSTGTVQVTLAARGQSLEIPRGEPLLSALEAAGVTLASGCRMGICNTCACGKRAGSSLDLRTHQLHHEPASALRLCVTAATTDLVLDL
jgi:stearoyl-CoA 9-desaturase NADPH oxidoreductase